MRILSVLFVLFIAAPAVRAELHATPVEPMPPAPVAGPNPPVNSWLKRVSDNHWEAMTAAISALVGRDRIDTFDQEARRALQADNYEEELTKAVRVLAGNLDANTAQTVLSLLYQRDINPAVQKAILSVMELYYSPAQINEYKLMNFGLYTPANYLGVYPGLTSRGACAGISLIDQAFANGDYIPDATVDARQFTLDLIYAQHRWENGDKGYRPQIPEFIRFHNDEVLGSTTLPLLGKNNQAMKRVVALTQNHLNRDYISSRYYVQYPNQFLYELEQKGTLGTNVTVVDLGTRKDSHRPKTREVHRVVMFVVKNNGEQQLYVSDPNDFGGAKRAQLVRTSPYGIGVRYQTYNYLGQPEPVKPWDLMQIQTQSAEPLPPGYTRQDYRNLRGY